MVRLDWKSSIQKFVKENPSKRNVKEIERETDELFVSHMETFAKACQRIDPSYNKVPRFFDSMALKKDENTIYNCIQKEARSRFLHHKTSEILDKEDLEKLWEEIKKNISPPEDGNERINYDSFLKIAKSLPQKCRHFFSASTFLKFDRDEYGRIDCVSFFHSIVRKVSLFQTRIQISLYDNYGNGYLKQKDLQNFIFELMPTFPNLSGMPSHLADKYLLIATKKFFFFLDPKHHGRIFIKDILTSPILAELYDLRTEKSNEEFLNNWFSLQNAQRIIELYNKLDEDKNGTLSVSEIAKFQWSLTDLFLKRVMEQHCFADSKFEMNFELFVEFILIIENKKNQRSINFIFKCLDVFDSGYIDSFVINMFFKEVLKKLMSKDTDADKNLHIEDVKDEIFDMANPKKGKVITLYDLYNCGQGDIILGILIDAKVFFDYDQRELGNTLNIDEDSQFEFVPGVNCDKLPNDKKVLENEETSASIKSKAAEFLLKGSNLGEQSGPAMKNYGKFAEV